MGIAVVNCHALIKYNAGKCRPWVNAVIEPKLIEYVPPLREIINSDGGVEYLAAGLETFALFFKAGVRVIEPMQGHGRDNDIELLFYRQKIGVDNLKCAVLALSDRARARTHHIF